LRYVKININFSGILLSHTYRLDIDSFHIKNIMGNSNLNRLKVYSRRT